MWNARLDESEAEVKIPGRNINSFRYANDITLRTENEEEPKEPLDEGERGEWENGQYYKAIALKTVGWKWKSLSCVRLFATPWTIQSTELSRSEYWSGYTFPSPGDLPDPGIEPCPPALQVDSLPTELSGKPF